MTYPLCNLNIQTYSLPSPLITVNRITGGRNTSRLPAGNVYYYNWKLHIQYCTELKWIHQQNDIPIQLQIAL